MCHVTQVVTKAKMTSRVASETATPAPRRDSHNPIPTEAQRRMAQSMSYEPAPKLTFKKKLQDWGVHH